MASNQLSQLSFLDEPIPSASSDVACSTATNIDEPIPSASSDVACSTATKPAARRVKKGGKERASIIPDAVASQFAMNDLFSEFLAVRSMAVGSFVTDLRMRQPNSADDGSDLCDETVVHEPTCDDEGALGPNALVTDAQLREEQLQWQPTEREIVLIHQACLEENLDFLYSVDRKAAVAREKAEILQWVFTVDDIDGASARQIPFSFHNCCVASGIDPDTLRRGLLQVQLVRDLLVATHLVMATNLPPLDRTRHYADYVGEERAQAEHIVYQFN